MARDRFFRRRRPQQQPGTDVPDLWTQCPACKEGVYNRDLEAGAYVCPKCGHHIRLDAAQRVQVLLDEGSFTQLSGRVQPTVALNFQDTEAYTDRLRRAQKKTGRPDAILTGTGTILDVPVTLAVTPPVVGSVSSLTYGRPRSVRPSRATVVLAICIRDRALSCMRAPPLAVTMIRGVPCAAACSAARAISSPTTLPMLPPLKAKSMTASVTGRPRIAPVPVRMASGRPVFFCARFRRSG